MTGDRLRSHPPPPRRLTLISHALLLRLQLEKPQSLPSSLPASPSVFVHLVHAPLRARALPASVVSLGAAQPAGLDVIAVVRDRRLRVDAPVRDNTLHSIYYCNTLSGTAGSSRIFLGLKTGTAPPHSRAQFTRELLTLTARYYPGCCAAAAAVCVSCLCIARSWWAGDCTATFFHTMTLLWLFANAVWMYAPSPSPIDYL